MKLMFASDIHGSSSAMENVKKAFESEKADKLILCGDLLYHGPRNDLPDKYDCKKTAEILNGLKNDIIAVRGNCDGEVDQMVLDFPILSDYTMLYADDMRIYVSHGHIYNADNRLKMQSGDVFVSGHTHVLKGEKIDGITFLNSGSCSIPKETGIKTYMVYENGVFEIKDFENNVVKEIKVK